MYNRSYQEHFGAQAFSLGRRWQPVGLTDVGSKGFGAQAFSLGRRWQSEGLTDVGSNRF